MTTATSSIFGFLSSLLLENPKIATPQGLNPQDSYHSIPTPAQWMNYGAKRPKLVAITVVNTSDSDVNDSRLCLLTSYIYVLEKRCR